MLVYHRINVPTNPPRTGRRAPPRPRVLHGDKGITPPPLPGRRLFWGSGTGGWASMNPLASHRLFASAPPARSPLPDGGFTTPSARCQSVQTQPRLRRARSARPTRHLTCAVDDLVFPSPVTLYRHSSKAASRDTNAENAVPTVTVA